MTDLTDAISTSTVPVRTAEQPLTGRRALVTGGASGIGAAVVRALAARGAHVVVADIDTAGATALADEVGGSIWTVNLMDTDALTDDTLATALHGVDILVNNAGIQRINPIQDFNPADFHNILTLMLEAPFLLIRAALPQMYAAKFGRIINVSSVHGIRASPFKSAYVSAKHGLEGLSKVTALEGGAYGVTSNCVAPGYVRTPLVEKQITDQALVHGIPEAEVLSKIMLTESAIKRLVEPSEVGSLVAWLASDDAAMVTGSSYTMDGGWSAR
ncbi:SDR family oxidoreductase [Cryobacterium sp. TMT1-3]|uniref:SDR family oxidoreductase n=1 Tax=Cryobacterium luteum TaxID=1424661 RepID=A0A1H8E720_9MICO|nr:MULTISPECIES: 3-hydroxybutyrate dehydrogenase [Cryobacterium]TFB89830.1 SDR family oxidoreductase [Cryobacterium luteum]TFC25543.1 SDR family oxidoreductase [Cryobacterium sp. TMT1-3]SEN15216.1 3-hydroxybutyrate dehydrogenase [Cryobacterium luteum]